MFSLFRQRGPRGFELVTRVYDPEKEARQKREERIRNEQAADSATDRALLAERMRHSWQRQHRGTGMLTRYLISIGMVGIILFFIIKAFGLLGY